MRVLIIHNAVAPDAPPDDRDVLVQVDAVSQALHRLGHEFSALPCDLDLAELRGRIRTAAPDRVFNLVESLGGYGRLIAHVPALLDALEIPYTGSPSEAIYLSSHKPVAKALLAAAGLSTPPTVAAHPGPSFEGAGSTFTCGDGLFVVKSVWEHASVGLDEESLVRGRAPEDALLLARSASCGGACFAEPFIEGREFNLSVLAGGAKGPQVLPAAEIDFRDFPQGKPRLVGYRAKWDEASFEYHHTPRRFDFPAGDAPLLEELGAMAKKAFRTLGLRGYARIDFRVDPSGTPWILEVNANPCLSPDAGFAAAAARGGLSFEEVVSRILADVGGSMEEMTERVRPSPGEVTFRHEPASGDPEKVRALVEATGMFRSSEVPIAQELVAERMTRGPSSGYHFVFAEAAGRLLGYACFGPIPCTERSWDLYWIAVHPDRQGRGLGRELLERCEAEIRQRGGTQLYVETSNRPDYVKTRDFYERCGYEVVSILEDFYAQGDAKATYRRILARS